MSFRVRVMPFISRGFLHSLFGSSKAIKIFMIVFCMALTIRHMYCLPLVPFGIAWHRLPSFTIRSLFQTILLYSVPFNAFVYNHRLNALFVIYIREAILRFNYLIRRKPIVICRHLHQSLIVPISWWIVFSYIF